MRIAVIGGVKYVPCGSDAHALKAVLTWHGATCLLHDVESKTGDWAKRVAERLDIPTEVFKREKWDEQIQESQVHRIVILPGDEGVALAGGRTGIPIHLLGRIPS